MKVFTDSQAQQQLPELLALARYEDVEIRCKDGSVIVLRAKTSQPSSPFDVATLATQATTADILDAVRAAREHD
ncbi:MAG TPA: hypothetical protein VIN71_01645 [Pseudomonadales bacterium]